MPFLETKSAEQATELWKKASPHIFDMHRRLWPGVFIRRLKSKQGRCADVVESQDMWLRESTMNTSLLMATVCHLINFKFRSPKSRGKACEGFSKLLTLLSVSLDGFTLEHDLFTNDGEHAQASGFLTVDASGAVYGLEFWGREFWESTVKELWDQDVLSEKKPWITAQSGIGKVPLCELLAFALDPQHPNNVSGVLCSRVFNLLTEICYLLDRYVDRLKWDHTSVDVAAATTKNKKRQKRVLVSVYAEQVVNKLWNGTAT